MLKSLSWAFQVALVIKNLPANAGDPGLERSPGGRNGNPLQYSCLENPMDRGAWRATVLGVEKSWTRLKWKPLRRPRPRELRAFFSCMAWRAIPGPLHLLHLPGQITHATSSPEGRASGFSVSHLQATLPVLTQ